MVEHVAVTEVDEDGLVTGAHDVDVARVGQSVEVVGDGRQGGQLGPQSIGRYGASCESGSARPLAGR
jgi:hypothetical protein